ncbi:MAG: HAMP domain-containing histidine kinase [Arcobacteraceae bacterium]|nr:HAMP domain-containing histidine kinase [Arcobacteraceae bacterium]
MRTEEKNILIKFILLYHISAFILLGIIAVLVFKMQYNMTHNLTVSHMQNTAFKISSQIINAQMQNRRLEFQTLCDDNEGYIFATYDKEKKKLFGGIGTTIDFSKQHYIQDDSIIVVDKSALGHLGVDYVVVKNDGFQQLIDELYIKVLLGFLISYFIMCAVGYKLIKMFMKPIQNERKRLDNFIKDTTHELNTPITAIMMCANKDSIGNPKNMERIYLSAKRISEIYKDLTYMFLKKESKNNITTIQVDEIIKNELEYFKLLASKKDIEIQSELEPTVIEIYDEDFKRIFSNLVSNSIKYNKRGGKVSITLKNKRLIVKDTGIGISKEKQNNIFKRYYRATSLEGGFGMGLNIVYNIAKEYEFTIDMQSDLNIGTTFTIHFS